MTRLSTSLVGIALTGALLVVGAGSRLVTNAQGPQTPETPPPQQPSEVTTTISSGESGAPPRFAVPDFIPLTGDTGTLEASRAMARVLWDDLAYEREVALIPRDTYATIPAAHSAADVPFDRWRELNADGVVVGTVQQTPTGIRVEARLFNVRSRQSVFGREYTGATKNARLYAHAIADELHEQQRALRGVARTKLTFASDRDAERVGGTAAQRGAREIYISDYDGFNQQRLTVSKSLNITPRWTPDARAIAYTSYQHGSPDIFISLIYQGTREYPTKGAGGNFLPAWSPDGARLAFMSNRDGNPEIYVINRDGSNPRRITNHPAADASPTWSPNGTQIAFVSDRSGSPQIYIVGADGLGLRRVTSESYCDKPTWSPAPYNEIAYAARTGPLQDIKVLDLATAQVRQLTFGEGTNESPAFASNGRHLAFMSTRSGRSQIFTIARDGKDLRQITTAGSNVQPDWSR